MSPCQTICTDRGGGGATGYRAALPPPPIYLSLNAGEPNDHCDSAALSGDTHTHTHARDSPGNPASHNSRALAENPRFPEEKKIDLTSGPSRVGADEGPCGYDSQAGFHKYHISGFFFSNVNAPFCAKSLPGARVDASLQSPTDVVQRPLVKTATRAINRVNTPQIKKVFNCNQSLFSLGDPAGARLEMNLMPRNGVCLNFFNNAHYAAPGHALLGCLSPSSVLLESARIGHKCWAGLIRCQPCHINYAKNESTLHTIDIQPIACR